MRDYSWNITYSGVAVIVHFTKNRRNSTPLIMQNFSDRCGGHVTLDEFSHQLSQLEGTAVVWEFSEKQPI